MKRKEAKKFKEIAELAVLSEKFYADFGCHWTEILN